MRVSRKVKIEHATGKREGMAELYLNVEDKTLVATDGCILTIADVRIDKGDTSGPVPVSAIKIARSFGGDHNDLIMFVNDKITIHTMEGAIVIDRPEPNIKFPNYKAITNDFKTGIRVMLDRKRLKKLADTLGADIVELDFQCTLEEIAENIKRKRTYKGPVVVRCADPYSMGGNGYGAIMPIAEC